MSRPGREIFCSGLYYLVLFGAVLGGCGCAIIGLLGTPTRSERKVEAEYALARHKDERVFVLVEQPSWLDIHADLRRSLTERIGRELVGRVKLSPERLISYDELVGFRRSRPDFALLDPVEIGRALDAGLVLYVIIDDGLLSRAGATDYYKALLVARCSLIDVKAGRKLWPEAEDGREVSVGFEVGPYGKEAAISRLTGAMAHCIVRYFYDCPVDKFKIGDERTGSHWLNWR